MNDDQLRDLIRVNSRLRQDLARERLRNRDLLIVVKDQKNHIANLEAQLLPHLKAGEAQVEQGSLL